MVCVRGPEVVKRRDHDCSVNDESSTGHTYTPFPTLVPFQNSVCNYVHTGFTVVKILRCKFRQLYPVFKTKI